jgi:predicted DNA-binding transcriptional regulator AlpA
MATQYNEIVTIREKELLNRYNLSRSTLYRLRASDYNFPHPKKLGSCTFYDVKKLDKYFGIYEA